MSRKWGFLQRFAAEDEGRTEEPTGKRISKARGEGNVAKSPEIPQVLVLLLGFYLLMRMHTWIVQRTMDHMRRFLGGLDRIPLTSESLPQFIYGNVFHLVMLTAPFLLLAFVVVLGAYIAQFGWLFSWSPLQPKLTNLFNPRRILDMFFGKTMLFNLVKSAGKVLLLSLLAYGILREEMARLYFLFDMPAAKSAEIVLSIAYEIVWKLCLLLGLFAAADYAYNHYRWKDSLKMTKFEVKDEQRQAEGDPAVKAAQKKRMMEIHRRRMLKQVPEADVVITNPTHYAVALKYDMETMEAPIVVAKGEGLLAKRIRQIAEEAGVPILERKELAQSLYKMVEVGDRIPDDLFGAVAEVLAYVYKQKGRRVRRAEAGAGR